MIGSPFGPGISEKGFSEVPPCVDGASTVPVFVAYRRRLDAMTPSHALPLAYNSAPRVNHVANYVRSDMQHTPIAVN